MSVNEFLDLIQDFLENTYQIKGYKINLRVYILLVCNNLDKEPYVDVYLFPKGIIRYTSKPFDFKSSTDLEKLLTSYPSNDSYTNIKKGLPVTFEEIDKYLVEHEGVKPGYLIRDLKRLVKLSMKPFMNIFLDYCRKSKLQHISMHIYGPDVGLIKNSGKIRTVIYEYNSNALMFFDSNKNKDEGETTMEMFKDSLGIVGILKRDSSSKVENRFLKAFTY